MFQTTNQYIFGGITLLMLHIAVEWLRSSASSEPLQDFKPVNRPCTEPTSDTITFLEWHPPTDILLVSDIYYDSQTVYLTLSRADILAFYLASILTFYLVYVWAHACPAATRARDRVRNEVCPAASGACNLLGDWQEWRNKGRRKRRGDEEEGRERRSKEVKKSSTPLWKSRDPHLAGGEVQSNQSWTSVISQSNSSHFHLRNSQIIQVFYQIQV